MRQSLEVKVHTRWTKIYLRPARSTRMGSPMHSISWFDARLRRSPSDRYQAKPHHVVIHRPHVFGVSRWPARDELLFLRVVTAPRSVHAECSSRLVALLLGVLACCR